MAKTGGTASEKARPKSSADQMRIPPPRSLATGKRRTHWFACCGCQLAPPRSAATGVARRGPPPTTATYNRFTENNSAPQQSRSERIVLSLGANVLLPAHDGRRAGRALVERLAEVRETQEGEDAAVRAAAERSVLRVRDLQCRVDIGVGEGVGHMRRLGVRDLGVVLVLVVGRVALERLLAVCHACVDGRVCCLLRAAGRWRDSPGSTPPPLYDSPRKVDPALHGLLPDDTRPIRSGCSHDALSLHPSSVFGSRVSCQAQRTAVAIGRRQEAETQIRLQGEQRKGGGPGAPRLSPPVYCHSKRHLTLAFGPGRAATRPPGEWGRRKSGGDATGPLPASAPEHGRRPCPSFSFCFSTRASLSRCTSLRARLRNARESPGSIPSPPNWLISGNLTPWIAAIGCPTGRGSRLGCPGRLPSV